MLLELEKTIVSVVEKVVPSVVSVSTTRMARLDLSRVVPLQGQGSGVILADDGHVVTNFHVVKGARHIDVTLNDGRSLHATVVGGSAIRDLAVLKIDAATDLTPTELGDSKSLKVGQFAIAVGYPLGLGTTVTFGMVSAIDRTIKSREAFLEGLIQTTAQINPGNSGGALVDTEAKLIGIPTAMIPWSQGIGFAIAIDGVKSVYNELVETGTIRTPWMGVVGITLNRGIAAHYRLPVNKGALIVQVPQGPALRAGLKPGDVIVTVDGKKVTTMEALRSRIIRKKVGDNIKLRFNRDQKVLEADLKLQEAPS